VTFIERFIKFKNSSYIDQEKGEEKTIKFRNEPKIIISDFREIKMMTRKKAPLIVVFNQLDNLDEMEQIIQPIKTEACRNRKFE
jgi:hypothetical protein